MSKYIRFTFILLSPFALLAQHPTLFISKPEAAEIKAALGKYPRLDRSFEQARQCLETALRRPLEVPSPGEAGGYEHEKHKQNYREMQQAGLLFAITGEARYAQFVRDLLLEYAKRCATPKSSIAFTITAPGRLPPSACSDTCCATKISSTSRSTARIKMATADS